MRDSKMNGQSLSQQEELLSQLQDQFPEIFREGKVDPEKLKQTLGEKVDTGSERYGLTWAGKSNCFREIQKTTTATLAPIPEESVDFDTTKNLFIEGDNLEVLRVLQRSYYGKVKMIYIDPPYNTGNDFIYDDNFKQDKTEYEAASGQKNGNGDLLKDNALRRNTRDNGHYHSDWLNMMYPRLFLARNLLRRDGVIFVSIDDNEMSNLKLIMNEVFGEENFIAEFVWKRRVSSAMAKNNVSVDHEYVLCYHKGNLEQFNGIDKDFKNYTNPDKDPRGPWIADNLTVGMTASMRPNQAYDLVDPDTGKTYPHNPNRVWSYAPESMKKAIKEGRIIFPKDTSRRPMLKRFKSELKSNKNPLSSILTDKVGLNTEATRSIQEIFGKNLFDYSKPLSLIELLIEQATSDGDIVLDFFAGSATTAEAVINVNKSSKNSRQFIMVQLPEVIEEATEASRAGYKFITDIAKDRIRKVGEKIAKEPQKKLDSIALDIGFKVYKLQTSNFAEWRGLIKNQEELAQQLELSVDNIKPNIKETSILSELILKSGLELTEQVEKSEEHGVTHFTVGDKKLIVCLNGTVTQEFIDYLEQTKPTKIIFLEKVFANNDDLKTNAILNLERADIDFKVV